MNLRYAFIAATLLASSSTFAQPTLTAATNVPAAGVVVTLNSAIDFQTEGSAGANVVYQHWNLLVPATGTKNISYLSPSVTSSSAQVPTATLLSTDSGTDTSFWAVTAAGLELVGQRVDPAVGGVLSFSDAALMLKLPCTYGTSWTDPLADSYMASGFPVTRTGTVTGNADAYGTLELPGAVIYPSVLRVHVRQDVTDATAIVTTNRIANIYSYYITTQAHPILTLELDSTRINAGAWAITKSQLAVGNPGLVGIEETGTDPVFTAYPNPATDLLNIAFAEGTSVATKVEVIDAGGRVVRSEAVIGGRCTLNTQDLDAGMYTARVLQGQRILGTRCITVM